MRWKPVSSTWNNLFRDHELYVRTDGQVRFLHVSARVQRRVATVALVLALLWLAGTAALLGWQAWTSWRTRDVAARAEALSMAEARVAADRNSVEGIAATLDQRQDHLEALFEAHFGDVPEAALPTASAAEDQPSPAMPQASPAARPHANPASVSQASPVASLQSSSARQDRLVLALTDAAAERASRAEAALKAVGIRPTGATAQGGPFIPHGSDYPAASKDPALRRLTATLQRMERLEALLVAIPSGQPVENTDLSSGFGVRYDPFNGQRAMHAGVDFRGAHASPIHAAAAGRISFVGVKSGYGKVMEVDHGHGLLTRYAHLSGFDAEEGQQVRAGQQIARMGSTGRSTGTHLHFEVRVNGAAVNPRRFLEANAHVLEVKADAGSRVRGRTAAS